MIFNIQMISKKYENEKKRGYIKKKYIEKKKKENPKNNNTESVANQNSTTD